MCWSRAFIRTISRSVNFAIVYPLKVVINFVLLCNYQNSNGHMNSRFEVYRFLYYVSLVQIPGDVKLEGTANNFDVRFTEMAA